MDSSDLLRCLLCNSRGSRTSSIWEPPESMTQESLDRLIVHFLDLLQSSETIYSSDAAAVPPKLQMDSSSDTWKEYTAGIPKCVQRLAARSRKNEADEGSGTATFVPLLLEGMGPLRWAAFAFSLLAFAMDNLDKEHGEFEDCLEVIEKAVLLLRDTKEIRLRDEIFTSGSGSDVNEPPQWSVLQNIANVSLRFCVIMICSSSNANIDDSNIRCFKKLAASRGSDSMDKVKGDIDLLKQTILRIQEKMQQPDPYLIPSNTFAITWGDHSEYWSRSSSITGSWCPEVQCLKNVCWLEVISHFEMVFKPGKHLVSFRIRFEDISGFTWSPIKLTMSVSTSDDETLIMVCERYRYLEGDQSRIVDDAKIANLRSVSDDWLELDVGEVDVENEMSLRVFVAMRETESQRWKSGLIIDCLKVTKAI